MDQRSDVVCAVDLYNRLGVPRHVLAAANQVVIERRSALAEEPVDAFHFRVGEQQLAGLFGGRQRAFQRGLRGEFQLNMELIAIGGGKELLFQVTGLDKSEHRQQHRERDTKHGSAEEIAQHVTIGCGQRRMRETISPPPAAVAFTAEAAGQRGEGWRDCHREQE